MSDAWPVPERAAIRGRVLLIDDDPQICRVFRRVLEWRGHEVMEASDGQQGMAAAQAKSPDIILLDLNLPVIGGLELLGQFARRLPEIPVIIVSGSGTMSDAISALKLGAWDYLIKPLPEVTSLAHTVESNLERARLIRRNMEISQELERHHHQIQEDEEAGRKIQARLFPPQTWSAGGYCFEHWSIPSLMLSGDFVDYFSLGGRHAGFYCADVSGHGVSSALVTVLVKSLMTKYREHFEEGRDRIVLEPDQLLAQLNKDLLHEQLGKHLTIFYGVIDQAANTLHCASGGQYPPPLLFSAGGLRLLDQKGMAVGLFPFATFEAETVTLPPAFRLVVFSDGALDALALPDADKRQAFLNQLSTREQLLGFVRAAGANKQLPDDLTVLSITRGGLP